MQKIKLSDYGYRILQIESAAACNMECSFCPYPLKDDKVSKLSLENIKHIINQVDPNDKEFKYVTFSQFNEPLLDKRIFEIIDFAQNTGLNVHMVTNGLLLNKEKNVENIIRLKPTVKISLQVLDATKHMESRGLNMELERYVNTIVNFCVKIKNQPCEVTVDIGCNYNSKYKHNLKKVLGLSTGDPSVPNNIEKTINQFKQYMSFFYKASDEKYKKDLEVLITRDKVEKLFDRDYIFQKGFKIFDNVTLKIKPFFYGRRIKDYKPINSNFSCRSEILAVLASGHVVPCCLAYDESISLGKIYNNSLKEILHENNFVKNLRSTTGEKHLTCRKCFGEPTRRGALVRNILNKFPPSFFNSKLMEFIKGS